MVSTAENVSNLSFGRITALTGTSGRPIGAPHRPPTAADGARPRTLISAAVVDGPLPPALVRAVSRTNFAFRWANSVYFCVASSAQVPVATGEPQLVPFRLRDTEYWPTFPSVLPSWRGRYASPVTVRRACKLMVMLCGKADELLCQMVSASPSRTFLAASVNEPSLSADTVQPVRGNGGLVGGSLSRPICAADAHDPRLPASVSAVSRT